MVPEFLDDALGAIKVRDDAGLGDLQDEGFGGHLMTLEEIEDEIREPRVEKVRRGDVDRDRQGVPGAPPGSALREGIVEHESRDRSHEAGFFGQRKELKRWDDAESGMG